jgi:streptomycin 6-kinase
VRLPGGLDWWRSEPGGGAWLDRLPRLAAELAEAWELELGPAFEGSHVSLVLPATRADGSAAALKLNFPHRESEHEADALAWWNGDGAVRLLARDDERAALLTERCEPGTQLWALDEAEAMPIAAEVLRRLRRPAPGSGPIHTLEEEAGRWVEELPHRWEGLGQPFERSLLDAALRALLELGSAQPELVVCHQDFHGGNVLLSERGWLVIDPKPLVGDPAFDAASLLRDRRDELAVDPNAGRRIRRRLDYLAEALDLDRERLRGWGIAHALAWGVDDDGVHEDHIACARWLLEAS